MPMPIEIPICCDCGLPLTSIERVGSSCVCTGNGDHKWVQVALKEPEGVEAERDRLREELAEARELAGHLTCWISPRKRVAYEKDYPWLNKKPGTT